MSSVIISVLVVGGTGLLIGFLLGIAGKKFEVKTDERIEAVREALPGNNCGGCGYPGCDGVAEAIVNGSAPVTACPVGGMEVARAFILPFIEEGKTAEMDYKTELQEVIQQNPEEKLRYEVEGETGPDHDKHFVVAVYLNSNCIGRGEGHSKKIAEQHAAREALKLMGLVK